MSVLVRKREDSKIIMVTPLGHEWKSLEPYDIIQVMPLEARYGSVVAVEYIDREDNFRYRGQ